MPLCRTVQEYHLVFFSVFKETYKDEHGSIERREFYTSTITAFHPEVPSCWLVGCEWLRQLSNLLRKIRPWSSSFRYTPSEINGMAHVLRITYILNCFAGKGPLLAESPKRSPFQSKFLRGGEKGILGNIPTQHTCLTTWLHLVGLVDVPISLGNPCNTCCSGGLVNCLSNICVLSLKFWCAAADEIPATTFFL